MNQLSALIDRISRELDMYKQSTVRLGRDTAAFVAAPRIEYPQPKMFEGKREAKDVENFL